MRSEFDLIQYFKKLTGTGGSSAPTRVLGIGDDCAVIPKDSETDLLVTTDMLVEDVDFRFKWSSAADLGHKALAVSLSDIAAMGGKPRFAMLALGFPDRIWESRFAEEFIGSYLRLADAEGVSLIGGDISKTPDKMVVDSWVMGDIPSGNAILRSGARPGDMICVTGSLGGARAGLELLESGSSLSRDGIPPLTQRLLHPNARTAEGRLLGELRVVTSMIDVSDGLCGDLGHICTDSGTGARLLASAIPVDPDLTEAIRTGLLSSDGDEPEGLHYALKGGEDFELLFTVPPSALDAVAEALGNSAFTCIGEITSHSGKIEMEMEGSFIELSPRGFSHF